MGFRSALQREKSSIPILPSAKKAGLILKMEAQTAADRFED
jgi:hypothetical protein